MKHNDKYNYHQGTRITDHGTRVYNIAGYKLPSVTTILAQTKDKTYLNDWRNKIGNEGAKYISDMFVNLCELKTLKLDLRWNQIYEILRIYKTVNLNQLEIDNLMFFV